MTVPCPHPVLPNDDQGWLGREPTRDEQDVVEWLLRRPLPARILHVGIGRALLTERFGARVVQGLTRDGRELANAESAGLAALLCNKYDVPSYHDRLLRPFDCIVDVNIRSYACCDAHFLSFMNEMRASLSPGGVLLTGTRGLDYLIPTSLKQLRRLCPDWSVRSEGNVVIMRPARFGWLRGIWKRGP